MLTASGGKDSQNVRARVLDFGGFSDTEDAELDKLGETSDLDRMGSSWRGQDGSLLNKRLDDKFELLLSNPRAPQEESSLRKRENLLTLWNGIKEGLISWQDISFPPAVVERFLQSNLPGSKLGSKSIPSVVQEAAGVTQRAPERPHKRLKKN